MLKFTFEGADLNEVLSHIEKFQSNIAGGATAVETATEKTPGKKPAAVKPPKEEKLTLEKIQLKCSSIVENASDKPAAKGAIKEIMSEFMVSKVTELEESEYAPFMAKLEEI